MEFVGLKSLTNASNWGPVRVRVCRIWDAMNTKTEELISLDMVVVDEEHNLMWVRVRRTMVPRFKNLLAVGCVYVITGYHMLRVTREYRPVNNPFNMSFTLLTSVEKVTNLVPAIPEHGFQFVSHATQKSRINDNTILTDIVGCLTEVGGVKTVSGGFRIRELKLISDNLVNFMVTLWGEDAERFVDQYNIEGSPKPLIVVFSSMKVEQYSGVLNFKKTSATHIYTSLEHKYVASLAERFTNEIPRANVLVRPSAPPRSAEEEMFENRMNISQVLNSGWARKNTGYKMTFVGSIAAVSTECGWYYFACKACKHGVSPVDGSYTCSSCDTKSDAPLILYKVQFDVRDETGVLSCVIWGNLAKRMIGSSSTKLFNQMDPDTETFPREVLALCGKKYIFKICLSDYNLKYGNDVFSVCDVFSADVKLEDKYITPTFDYEETSQQLDVSSKGKEKVGVDVERFKVVIVLPKKRKKLGMDVDRFEVVIMTSKKMRKFVCDDSDDDTE